MPLSSLLKGFFFFFFFFFLPQNKFIISAAQGWKNVRFLKGAEPDLRPAVHLHLAELKAAGMGGVV